MGAGSCAGRTTWPALLVPGPHAAARSTTAVVFGQAWVDGARAGGLERFDGTLNMSALLRAMTAARSRGRSCTSSRHTDSNRGGRDDRWPWSCELVGGVAARVSRVGVPRTPSVHGRFSLWRDCTDLAGDFSRRLFTEKRLQQEQVVRTVGQLALVWCPGCARDRVRIRPCERPVLPSRARAALVPYQTCRGEVPAADPPARPPGAPMPALPDASDLRTPTWRGRGRVRSMGVRAPPPGPSLPPSLCLKPVPA